MDQPPVGKASLDESEVAMMGVWAKMYGAFVRQRTVRQETTTSRAGRLLDYLYQKDVYVHEQIVLLWTFPRRTQ